MPRRERVTSDLHTRPWERTTNRVRARRSALPGAHISARRGRVIAARDYEGHQDN
jgi:hypothetical protein